jgi:hypothetical protein
MTKFEYTTGPNQVPQTTEADDCDLDMPNGKLTFFDKDRKAIATFKIKPGAQVRRLDMAS